MARGCPPSIHATCSRGKEAYPFSSSAAQRGVGCRAETNSRVDVGGNDRARDKTA